MKAAIYARYSTDKQRESSIKDQFRNCEKFAKREGWVIQERYSDSAVSGSNSDRPEYQRMLTNAKVGSFDVLLVDDLSRLSRDEIEMKQVIRRFKYQGIRIIGVSDGFDTDSKGHKIQASVRGLINEIYIDDLADKTHRGLTGQALKGKNCGGKSYGYDHVPEIDDSKTDQYGHPIVFAVHRKVNKKQAKVINQIFKWYVEGHAPRWIAAELNKQGTPSPRGGKWRASAIYGHPTKGTGILNNPLYIGRYIWNRTEWIKDPDTGKRKPIARPESDWVVNELPELRIVPQALWDKVKAHQKEIHKASTKQRAALHQNARTGAGPKYLFSGLLKCEECGGNFVMISKHTYGCSSYTNGGKHACSNKLRVSRKLVETKLLEGIKNDLFTPEAIKIFRKETSRLLRAERTKRQPEAAQTKRQLAKVEKQVERMVDAIANGTDSATLHTRLKDAEAESEKLKYTLKHRPDQWLDRIPDILPKATTEYHKLLANMEGTTQRQVARARAQIKHLLGGGVKLAPATTGDHLEALVQGDYVGLLKLAGAGAGAPENKCGSGGRI